MYFDWTVEIDGTDVSEFVHAGGTIDYGRPTVNSGFQVPRAVFRMPPGFEPSEPPAMGDPYWGSGLYIGAPVTIHVTYDGYTQWRRFSGQVWAVDWTRDSIQVTCLGISMDLESKRAGFIPDPPVGVPYPSELDLDRAVRLGASAGVIVNKVGTQGRYLNGRPAPSPAENLLTMLLDMELACDATLMETRLGDVDYRGRVWAKPARYEIPAGLVDLDEIDMVYEGGAVVNKIEVVYGPDADQSVIVTDAASIATIGVREKCLTTDLRYLTGAQGKARTALEANALTWHAPDVTVVMGLASTLQADDVLTLGEGYPIRVVSLPDDNPLGYYDGDILGITDVMHPEDYRIVLHLSPGTNADPGPEFPEYVGNILYNDPEVIYGR